MGIRTEIAKGLYSKLAGAGLGVDVFDVAPQSADGGDSSVFPYVVCGRVILNEKDTQTTEGAAFLARIHTLSRSGETGECLSVQDAIQTALHLQSLPLAGFANYMLHWDSSDVLPEVDGKIRGVCEYRGLVEKVT